MAYSGQLITVRGIYYNGLREDCPQRCPNGEPWPSVLDLVESTCVAPRRGKSEQRVPFSTDQESWDRVDRLVLEKATTAERVEIWVTAHGILRDQRRSPLGPCDWVAQPMFGGLQAKGRYGAALIVESMSDIEVRSNPSTPYDYSTYLRKKQ